MKRPLIVLLLLLCTVSAFSQSGRRVKAAPTPETKTEDPEDQYSESVSLPRRQTLMPPQLRPSVNTPAAPTASAPSAEEDGADVIKVSTDLVTIPVSVFDRNGLYIPGLQKSNFKIFQDGKEQEIAYFGTDDKPFTVVLMLDTSPSTEYRIEDIQAAARAFVDQLKPQDKVMVVEFALKVHFLTDPTSDREEIYNAIKKTGFSGGTSLYDAVHLTIAKRLNAIEGRKAIVLFTDGVDTTSTKANYDSTLDEAEESDALIFPIYFNTFLDNNRQNGGGFPNVWGQQPVMRGTSAGEYAVGKKYLEELADYTAGRVFRPESTPGGLRRAFEGIAEELRRQYNIGFVPAEEGKPGQRKQIKVRVDRPNLIVRARDSYIVGATKAQAAVK